MQSVRIDNMRTEAPHALPHRFPRGYGGIALPMALACLLTACGGGGDDHQAPSGTGFAVSGNVSGLASGKRAVLQNNGADELVVTADGSFTFASRVVAGAAYAVTIKTQPDSQTCAVSQGNGVATANVSDIAVRCQNLPVARYSVGGTISGLATFATLVLQNNGGDDLTVSANGGFTFAAPLAAGSAFAVTVKSQPAGQTCTVRNGSGKLGESSLSSVQVSCAANTSNATLPAGDWQLDTCSQGMRTLWRIVVQSSTSASMEQGVVQYGNAQCTGPSTVLVGPNSSLGGVMFDRSESTATLTAFWGTWKTPSGITSRTVWARTGDYLCILGDENPSILPNAQAVESSANIQIANKGCYTKR